MSKRRTGRKLAIQALYQIEIQGKSYSESILQSFIEDSAYLEETKKWALFLAKNAWDHHEEADRLIQEFSIGWALDRVLPLDKSVLRLAFYELLYTETPVQVIIDEAVEFAKRYSTEDSSRYINGILGKCVEIRCLRE